MSLCLQLWHLAKMHGEAADKATDAHFMRAARAHQALLGVHSRELAPRHALCAHPTCQADCCGCAATWVCGHGMVADRCLAC